MTIFALILSLFFPLCGTQGAAGITPPGVVDFTHLHLLGHSEFLAGPPGYFAQPDQQIPLYNIPPAELYADIIATGPTLPRTTMLDLEPQALQAAYVARSRFSNYPDITELAVIPEPDNQSGLIIYSRALYGAGDYGVNRKHVAAWLQTLQTLQTKVSP
jgi:hypothetical protein